jgi:protein-histidine pros-kinase
MRLQNTFSIALGITFLASFVIVAVLFYRGALHEAELGTLREARLILAAATAARTYSSDHVTPLLSAEQPAKAFSPEVVPSFAAQTTMKGFNAAFPEYSYREKALDPTSLDDLPRAWESDIIQHFKEDANLKEMTGERIENGRLFVYIAQPICIDEAACLTCHSEPKNAPPAMLAAYGPVHGFGWKQGEVIGAKFISVPKTERLALALSNVFWFLVALGCVLVVAVMVTIVLVRTAVVNPIQSLAVQAEALSVGKYGSRELTPQGSSEFRALASAINRLHRSLMLAFSAAEKEPVKRAGKGEP